MTDLYDQAFPKDLRNQTQFPVTNPNDPVAVNAHATLIPKDLPEEWCAKVQAMTYTANGLTKREYFAGLAMQGLLANSEQWKYMGSTKLDFRKEIRGLALEFADALIAELNK